MKLGVSSLLSRTLAMLFVAHAVHHSYITLIPLLFPIFRVEFNLSYTQLGILSTSFLLTYAALQAPASFLLRFVERKFILGFGLAWMALATLLTGFSTSFALLVFWQLLSGVGASTYHPMGSSLASKIFSRDGRGKAMGIHLAGGNLGTSLGPVIGGFLVAAVGWRQSLSIFVVPGLAVGLLFILFARDPLGISPADAGKMRGNILKILRNKAVIAITAASALTLFRFRGITSFAPSYFTAVYGWDISQAGLMFGIMQASGFFSPLLFGYVSDRFGRKPVVILATLSSALSIFLMTVKGDMTWTIANLVFVGFTLYSSASVLQALLADIVAPELIDLCFGIFFTFDFLIGTIAPLLLGFIIDVGSFEQAFYVMAIATALSALMVMPVRESARRTS